MANALTPLNPEFWSRQMQIVREKEMTAMDITNMELRALAKKGDTVHRPYRSNLRAVNYTRGTDLTMQDLTGTDESLVIDQIKAVPAYIDWVDDLQSNYELQARFAGDMMADLNRQVDAKVLSEYDNATSTVIDSDVGQTNTGDVITLTEDNVSRIFAVAGRKLDNQNVRQDGRFAIVSPSFVETLRLYTGGRETSFGDTVLANGFIGERFGFRIYKSTNLTLTATWTPANNPSNTQTLTINGVVVTFVTSLTGAGGEVVIGGTTALTLDNLVALLDDPYNSAASVNYSAFSQANAVLLEGIDATDGTTVMTIEHVGGGEVALATSESADPWSSQTLHSLFGRKGAIDLVMQRTPRLDFNQETKRPGPSLNIIASMLYGVKTFTEPKDELVDVKIDGSGF